MINGYVCGIRDTRKARVEEATPIVAPLAKKRKLNHSHAPNQTSGAICQQQYVSIASSDTAPSGSPADENSLLQIKDISFSLPQRKKYTIDFTSTHILARNPTTGELIPGISYAYANIAYAFCTPVPEKATKQYSYVLFPRGTNLPVSRSTPLLLEPLMFTIPSNAPKPGALSGSEANIATSYSDTHKDLFDWLFSMHLPPTSRVQEPSPKQFTSVTKESHRISEQALFCKAFRGSKDGYLFFLATGILFLFKKPVLFIPKDHIMSVAYAAVLRNTFNLCVQATISNDLNAEGGEEETEEEFEFAMLDQDDFEGIDMYVKRNGLQDKSMGEKRKAKRLGINDTIKENGEIMENDSTDLAQAEVNLQKVEYAGEEDEEQEEDYDPGSDGESEGSGSDTDDYNSDADNPDDINDASEEAGGNEGSG